VGYGKCGVLHFGVQWLTRRALSAYAELLVQAFIDSAEKNTNCTVHLGMGDMIVVRQTRDSSFYVCVINLDDFYYSLLLNHFSGP